MLLFAFSSLFESIYVVLQTLYNICNFVHMRRYDDRQSPVKSETFRFYLFIFNIRTPPLLFKRRSSIYKKPLWICNFNSIKLQPSSNYKIIFAVRRISLDEAPTEIVYSPFSRTKSSFATSKYVIASLSTVTFIVFVSPLRIRSLE